MAAETLLSSLARYLATQSLGSLSTFLAIAGVDLLSFPSFFPHAGGDGDPLPHLHNRLTQTSFSSQPASQVADIMLTRTLICVRVRDVANDRQNSRTDRQVLEVVEEEQLPNRYLRGE